ncbi:SDR family oxidoreductase [Variovorax sp. J31P179]|uniref:SDR family NAD(P)-dependent oxidoreductase n=1 Tax=Variovorax sp. J31P179 TaxID=3053508 RepID=UPI002577598F|nr:SDR family oxidoreductase [Variovorax sp. J31P179]MDM0085390.1 SDR family oxidoreductase [Variovorax sp. J31P179]
MNLTNLLENKLALVTGAGQGNGRAIAIGLAKAGARVIVTDVNEDNAATTAHLIHEAGGQAESQRLDITDADACSSVVADIEGRIGPLDVLINNAGILIRGGIDSPDAARNSQQVMKVNYEGNLNVILACLPGLRRSKGTIVNVGSIASFIGYVNTMGYAPSKGAIRLLTQSLAAELAKDGVRVNAIAPGVIATEMSAHSRADPAKIERLLARVPMGRVAEPEELVGAVLFLASSMSTYVTGITVPVDGGFLAA